MGMTILPNLLTGVAGGPIDMAGNAISDSTGILALGTPFSAPNYDIGNIGAFDAQALTVAYAVDDFITGSGPTSGQEHTFSQSGTNNVSSLCCVSNGDNNNLSVAAVDAQAHPGNLGVCTLNTGYATATAVSGFKWAYSVGSGVTQVFKLLFRTASAISDGTNTYKFFAGPAFAAGAGQPFKGFYLRYDIATSPNWQYGQCTNAGVETMATSTVAYAAGAWLKLRITFAAAGASNNCLFELNSGAGYVTLGSITVTANNLALVSQATFPLACVAIDRTVSDTTSYRTGYLDRIAYYATGLVR